MVPVPEHSTLELTPASSCYPLLFTYYTYYPRQTTGSGRHSLQDGVWTAFGGPSNTFQVQHTFQASSRAAFDGWVHALQASLPSYHPLCSPSMAGSTR
eukprot:scaffold103662_cov51-Phaeocystis_antarctica.AAC.2